MVGGAAAWMLMRPSSASAQTDSTQRGPTQDPAAACEAIKQQIYQIRTGANPDPGQVRRLEEQLAECVRQLQAGGGEIGNFTSNLAEGDRQAQHAIDKFGEYQATDYFDAVKRNNLRRDVIDAGARAAIAYAESVRQTASDQDAHLARLSILRALEAAHQRYVCYLFDRRGCGRLGVNEDHGNDKAAQELERIIRPLVAAHDEAVQKVGGPGRERVGKELGDRFVENMLFICRETKAQIDGEFNHYVATNWSDALKRNNTRQTMLSLGGSLVACLRSTYEEALKYGSIRSLRAVQAAAVAALDAAMDRKLCYQMNGRGCGTMAANEDQPDAKAHQEDTRTVRPLIALNVDIAKSVERYGNDPMALAPLVRTLVREAKAETDYATAQFNHLKATDYIDPLKRGNTRGTILAFGASAAAKLRAAFDLAKNAGSSSSLASAVANLLASDNRLPLNIGLMPTSGLGQLQLQSMSLSPSMLQSQTLATQVLPSTLTPEVQQTPSVPVWRQTVAREMTDGAAYLRSQVSAGRISATSNQGKFADAMDSVARNALTASIADNTLFAAVTMGNTAFKSWPTSVPADIRTRVAQAFDRALAAVPNAISGKPTAEQERQSEASIALVKQVATVALEALDRSYERYICFQTGASGCGRLDDATDPLMRATVPGFVAAPRETDDGTKAREEKQRVLDPTYAIARDAGAFLAGKGDDKVENQLAKLIIKEIDAARARMNAEFNHLKATRYEDPLKRINTRSTILAVGRGLVSRLREFPRFTSRSARFLVQAEVQKALNEAHARATCYQTNASGCGRLSDGDRALLIIATGGAFLAAPFEADAATKVREENNDIIFPLTELMGERYSLAGLGGLSLQTEVVGLSVGTWLGISVAALGGYWLYKQAQRAPQKNRRRRRARTAQR